MGPSLNLLPEITSTDVKWVASVCLPLHCFKLTAQIFLGIEGLVVRQACIVCLTRFWRMFGLRAIRHDMDVDAPGVTDEPLGSRASKYFRPPLHRLSALCYAAVQHDYGPTIDSEMLADRMLELASGPTANKKSGESELFFGAPNTRSRPEFARPAFAGGLS
jgi:hypothetical protein